MRVLTGFGLGLQFNLLVEVSEQCQQKPFFPNQPL